MCAKIESERLSYIKLNQQKLRVEECIHLRDAITNDENVTDIGRIVIHPATYIGSARHMHEYAQDAKTYVRSYGRPDLFITCTCNTAWSEIKEELAHGQSPADRHKLIARVFRQKLVKFIDIITESCICGEVNCCMYSIEWTSQVCESDALGRVYTIHPNNAECFYLRLLLHTHRGPTSFTDLKTVEGSCVKHTEKHVLKLGLLEDDPHWDSTFKEATVTRLPPQLRDLFALIITTCAPQNPKIEMECLRKLLAEVETDEDSDFGNEDNGPEDVIEENFSDHESFSDNDTESEADGDSGN
ncbi:hypothetical protein AVEN_210804-1 [Araneus ventricosus]|uniref:Helitron helicase-like domain-containing protein n=1 Tax=Araneus ventricosus TaxID=182803 RepID=A0A4Y2CP50_ARAVE|nr:hypothetical protein AVEN_210804-1 [Araneus ventricosus]